MTFIQFEMIEACNKQVQRYIPLSISLMFMYHVANATLSKAFVRLASRADADRTA